MINKNSNILIVGLGLIGCSYAMALSRRGYQVSAIDPDYGELQYALEKGFIKTGFTKPNENAIKNQDIIILGLYPNLIIPWINDNQQFFKSGAIITDTCGVKCSFIYELKDILRKDVEFVGGHPMLDNEYSGAFNSDDALFEGINYIVTPMPYNSSDAVDTVKEIGEILGVENIVELDPKTHDEMVGYLSQLVKAIAISIMNAKDVPHMGNYTGNSYRELTRMSRVNDELWSEIFINNKSVLTKEIDSFIKQLQNLKRCLANDDVESLQKMMKLSTDRRDSLDD